ncbi:distal tail protein Dit, partial [Ornithinibacillus sp. JPR2-1]|uniref:distal tail protein Dit n=1 Tax=Ornithinibacillus sp. JPR2-1 TaxID=2094019 RepID=UPI0031D9284C
MIFNGIEKDYLIPLTGRRRSAWAPVSRVLVTVPGMAGAYLSRTETQIREIVVPVIINAENIEDLQKIKEDMAEWLVHDEPKELIFKDEPDRVYYAVVDGELELDEIFSTGRGEITFICADPYKYGPEKTYEFQDSGIVENKGTADAEPVIELTATQKATFAMISNGTEEYNLIGTPADDDVVVVDEKTSVLY